MKFSISALRTVVLSRRARPPCVPFFRPTLPRLSDFFRQDRVIFKGEHSIYIVRLSGLLSLLGHVFRETCRHIQDQGQRWLYLRLVWSFAKYLLMRRGAKLWYVLASILWLDFHRVVLNTLLLDYALYDFCLTKTQFLDACRRLPLIAIAKLALICVDRFASHVQNTETGSLSSTCFLQEMLIHQYLQSYTDTVEMGQFLHLLSVTVPESVTYGYKPAFQLVHCFNNHSVSLYGSFSSYAKGRSAFLRNNPTIDLDSRPTALDVCCWIVDETPVLQSPCSTRAGCGY